MQMVINIYTALKGMQLILLLCKLLYSHRAWRLNPFVSLLFPFDAYLAAILNVAIFQYGRHAHFSNFKYIIEF